METKANCKKAHNAKQKLLLCFMYSMTEPQRTQHTQCLLEEEKKW